MTKTTVISHIKKHPIAIAIFILYIALWIWLCWLTYQDLTKGDGEIIKSTLFNCFTFISLPYLFINILLAFFYKKHRAFYKELCLFIAVPIGMVIIIFIVRDMVAYMNKGV